MLEFISADAQQDGAGPVLAIIDTTATGKFSTGIPAPMVLQVPGIRGRMFPNGTVPDHLKRDEDEKVDPEAHTWLPRGLGLGFMRKLRSRGQAVKRAPAVNKDFDFKVEVPGNVTCEGEVAGKKGVCFLKVANCELFFVLSLLY